tara:strand:- start:67 stop:492 length:426 start_codon:yes stop_codon:yes gene_type:complete
LNSHTYPLHKEKNGVFRPKIPVRIVNFDTGKSIPILALIDTGADSCTFPSMVTLTLGYDLTEENKKIKGTRGVSGDELDTYVHPFKIELLDNSRKETLRTLEIVGHTIVSNSLPPILGTHLFLQKFKFIIDYLNNELTLEW